MKTLWAINNVATATVGLDARRHVGRVDLMAFTSLSPMQAMKCTHFRRHEINFDFTADVPEDDDNADADGDDDEFDDAIMERLTHANMPMHAHFDAA